jgi:hypothetical protein
MKNSLGVSGGQSCAELACNVESLVLGQTTDAPQQRGEVFPIDILDGEEEVPSTSPTS